MLKDAGYFAGFTGKGWGPGIWKGIDGGKSGFGKLNPAGKPFVGRKIKKPYKGMSNTDYAGNFKPDRWPAGDPKYGFSNTDGSPTKKYLTALSAADPDYRFFEMGFGKRPAEELYDIVADPDCVNNIARDPAHAGTVAKLWKQLQVELTAQGDPRILGKGDIFDYYPNCRVEIFKAKYPDGK